MIKNLKKAIHHYFFPHESNNYKAKSLQSKALIYYIVILLFIQFLSGFLKHTQSQILGFATDITVEEIIALVNQERTKSGLSPLNYSLELSQAATEKATDMLAKNYWAHVSPTGVTPWVYIQSAGYNYTYAGENLARSFDTTEEMVGAWMNSPTHRANILKPEYTDIGLAVVNGKLSGEETTLVVQEFGSSRGSTSLAHKNTSLLPSPMVNPPLASTKVNSYSTFSLPFSLSFTKTFSLVLAEFLLVLLFIDTILIWKHKTVRISGHSLAHILFLASLIGAMGATGVGVIL